MKHIVGSEYNIHINNWSALKDTISAIQPSQVFVLVDENTEKYCLHQLFEHIELQVRIIRIPSGERNKTIETCQHVWSDLLRKGADRHALMLNLGGGVIGDLGGFCAATFMRGIPYIQIPTTLLAQVDASLGGKTGVDFGGFKNMIGLIQQPLAVFVYTDYLETLPDEHMKSGFAELLKHGLIADKNEWQTLSKSNLDSLEFENIVYQSLLIKKAVTDQDPGEKGVRKILNFGHTIGHAVESYWMDSRTPLLHGEAVAIGMVSEAFLSYRVGNISETDLFDIRNSIIKLYGHHPKYVKPAEQLLDLMKSDKKNYKGEYRFSLLQSIGRAEYDVAVASEFVEESLLFYKERIG
ncbi:MAG: 3-dehydroquinate synthase [Saprospiraceae bacterium]|nr:MAG: 3-dehydroquinate synthase [Bacteroidetes bacterium OLB9]MCO6464942.1 3-dehydroquinate synthase [Saprospiraceae bacterium]MCZ2338415.1 3-dehydroquinate synthase [Chitinophagales bacterium]